MKKIARKTAWTSLNQINANRRFYVAVCPSMAFSMTADSARQTLGKVRFNLQPNRDSRAAGGMPMSHLFWLDQEHLKRIQHLFPTPRGVARSDDRRVLCGIIHVIRNGLRWRDAPPEYGPHKTLYNRFVRWSRMGVFARVFRELAQPGSDGGKPLKRGDSTARYRSNQRRPEQQAAHSL